MYMIEPYRNGYKVAGKFFSTLEAAVTYRDSLMTSNVAQQKPR